MPKLACLFKVEAKNGREDHAIMSEITPIKQRRVKFERVHTPRNALTNWDEKWKRKQQHYGMEHLQLMYSQKALRSSWCSRLRMALLLLLLLLSCCNTLPPNCHTPHSVAKGPLVLDKGPDWGCFDTSAPNHRSILTAPRWWTNGSQEGCPRHKSDYGGDSTQNRWIVLGSAMLAASLVSLSHTTLFIIWEWVKRMPYQASPPLPQSPFIPPTKSLAARTPLWTLSRVSYWCNWKCFVIAFSQILMDVKLNEVWVLVIRLRRCEIYHQRLKSLQGTIKAPPPSASPWTVHYYSLK